MFFLGFFPAGEQNVPHALAYGIHALEVRFFPFVDDLGLFLPAAVSPLSIPQPVTPLDAVSEAIVFQIVDVMAADGKEVRLEQAEERLMRPAAAEDAEQGGNGLGGGMAGHRPAIVAEAGNPIAPENAFDPVVVQVTRPGQDQEVAITIALTAEHCYFPGNAVDFAIPVGTFPDFQGRYGPVHAGRDSLEKSIAKGRQRAGRPLFDNSRFHMGK